MPSDRDKTEALATREVLPGPEAVQAVMNAEKACFDLPGVIKIYAGWHFEDRWITHRRAIVVYVHKEFFEAVKAQLPDQLQGFPIEYVVGPRRKKKSPGDGAQGANPNEFDATVGFVVPVLREEDLQPSFPGEILYHTTPAPLDIKISDLWAALRPDDRIQYKPPAGVSLAEREFDVDELTVNISPDQGWACLKPFLATTKRSLIVGMYEFTAPHIDSILCDTMAQGGRTLELVLDSPSEPRGKREQTVEDTDQHLKKALGQRLDFAWALSGQGTESPAKEFTTSYHIKVAVRDDVSIWLSSGNWNTSNLPDLDPANVEEVKDSFSHSDRDWHVVCRCDELAGVFKAHIENDLKVAKAAAYSGFLSATFGAERLKALADETLDPPKERPHRPMKLFEPKTISGKITIQPLLTPQAYREPILKLIERARVRFYMQTQYIHTGSDGAGEGHAPVDHMALIRAVAKLYQDGCDVRIITSEYQSRMWIESLQNAGVDATNCLKIQPNVHNKGIVVDTETSVISSQNWSPAGTETNRDAGLLIRSPELATYLEEIFLHDWEHLAQQRTAFG
ncbi:phospholipase D-like domain-containing protein [Mesorhizobium sp. M0025]|uniref:phospholipase D-like domain-containing protein n=1 Tax=Mesorhizobium sp. M0025 TaxID=2956846 RepID=UPI0033375280